MLERINKFFRDNLFSLVLASILFGFLLGWQLPQVTPSLSSLIVPILFLMIFVMVIPLEFGELIAIRKYKKEIVWGMLAILILAPLIAYFISLAFPEQYDFLKTGLILAATMPPGGMIVSWAGLLNANLELAMILQISTFILALVTIPLTLSLLLSGSVHFSQSLLVQNISFYIFSPLILGSIIQALLKIKYPKEKIKSWKPTLATISTLCALLVIFISTSLKANDLLSHPEMLIVGLLLATVYYLITFLVILFLSGFFIDTYDNQMPIVYGTVSKNLSIGVALALSAFSSQVALGVIFCFIVQMPLLSLFYKFIRKEEQEFADEAEKEKRKHPIAKVLRKVRTAGKNLKKSS